MKPENMLHVFCNLEDLGDGSDPMCDMTFEIVGKKYDEQASAWKLQMRADASPYKPVGFDAVIPVTGWREQVEDLGDEEYRSYWGNTILQSCGSESDELLLVMAEYYEIPAPGDSGGGLLKKLFGRLEGSSAETWNFVQSIECLTVGIASDPSTIADERVRMKLFFEDGEENGRYAEVFLIVDMTEDVALLNEKDEEYRADLIHWLSSPEAAGED